MKFKSVLIYFITVFALAFSNTILAADSVQYYIIDASASSIKIGGKSTLHPIEININDFTGRFTFTSDKDQIAVAGDVYVRIESMVSGKKGLDRNMYRMFDSKNYPQAHCRVESMVFKATESGQDEPISATLNAVLTIKEVSQPFESEVTVTPVEKGFVVKGSAVVSTKSFELRPPTIFGVIRMHDDITINFDVLVKPEGR